MADALHATYVEHDRFSVISGESKTHDVLVRVQTPFVVEKDAKMKEDDEYYKDDDDVVIRGPVYVGNASMQDRHGELVAMSAIMKAWDGYKQNPVILYNHSKTHGVIGRMTDVEMGEFSGMDEEVPIGRAIIDGGEKDIVRKIRKGMLKAFSIGFIAKAAVKECKDDDTCYMTFTEIDWLETSVVDVPASPNALFNVEKHILGYEDMGDRIAVLFEKQPAESPSEEPGPMGDMESPNEESIGGCGCGGSNCASNEKREIETDVFTTVGEAEARAEELGCEGIHSHTIEGDDGDLTVYMPCNSHDAYTDATGDDLQTPTSYGIDADKSDLSQMERFFGAINERLSAIEASMNSQLSKSEMTDSLNTPVEQPMGQNGGTDMTEEDMNIETPTEEDLDLPTEAVEMEAPVEEVVIKTEEVAEEAEEVAEEELPEEAVEEVAEATEEESADESMSTAEVLIEVVKTLSHMDSRLTSIESHMAAHDDVSALKEALSEAEDRINELTQAKEAAEAEAEIEAEVAKRVAERMASVGVPSTTIEANPKSLSAEAPAKKEKGLVVRHDPEPSVSAGMNGLANWLSAQVAGRGD